jgi:hypothetical protein
LLRLYCRNDGLSLNTFLVLGSRCGPRVRNEATMPKLADVYLVQPYEPLGFGDFEPWVLVERSTLDSAVRSAEELCRTYGGAVVFSAKTDLITGGYGSCEVLRKFGEVPEDPML